MLIIRDSIYVDDIVEEIIRIIQAGDVPITYADTFVLERDYGFKPKTSLREGLRKFAEWYKKFYMKGDK